MNNELTIDELVSYLQNATDHYENGNPVISDEEYDTLYHELTIIDPQNPYLTKVGSEVRGGKVALPIPMLGISQVFENEFNAWVKSLPKHTLLIASDKLDGTSILLQYSASGNLEAAFSRGNGSDGADLTRHAKKIKSLPNKIDNDFGERIFIRAEVEIEKSKFVSISDQYANPRNYVAGQMNREVSDDFFYENVSVIPYTIYGTNIPKSQQLAWIAERFDIPTFNWLASRDLDEEYLISFLNERRNNSPYDLDGIVITVDTSPDSQIKFKVADASNYAEVEVVGVEWNASKHGLLKPRIQIVPTSLCGVTIEWCTGFNAKFIFDNKIGPGSVIAIKRAGDVIPRCLKTISPSNHDHLADLPGVEWKGVDIALIESTDEVAKKKIEHFFATLKVEGAGPGAVDAIYNSGWISIESIITSMDAIDFEQALGKNGINVFASFDIKINNVELETLADASGCYPYGVGTTRLRSVSETLGKPFNSFDITYSELLSVDGVEIATAEKILSGNQKFYEFLKNIDGCYSIKVVTADSNVLEGKVFEFTGFRDDNLVEVIRRKGGSTGSKFNILIAKDPNSNTGKVKKANEKGIKILSIAEAKKLIGV